MAKSKTEVKKPVWLKYTEKEVKDIILAIAKKEEGITSEKIGLILRDTYGIPDVKTVAGKSITAILKEKNLLPEIPEDLMDLIRKLVMIRKHLDKNHKDRFALRGLQLTESKIKRLIKYYKQNGKLALDWEYDIDKMKLFVE